MKARPDISLVGPPRAAAPVKKFSAVMAFLLLALAAVAQQNPNSIIYSKHNLSVSGPGTLRSATEREVCIFCHAPHNATGDGPLWNHALSAASYTPYSSSTLKAVVGQPTGASKLCLSCHDGTVALGMVGSRPAPITMKSGAAALSSGRSYIGTDLSAHHPVSFDYRTSFAGANGELRDPSALVNNVRLDRSGQLQCTSCHDPHNNQYGTFLVMANTASALCVQCHKPNQWVGSAHATSTAVWNGTGANPWPHSGGTTVAANGCENCHRPHAAGSPKRLLNFTPEEQNCLVCHSGTVATKDIASELNKVSVHPVLQTSGIHDAAELALSTSRHVTCVDCHNPHATKASASPALEVSGSLANVRGINAAGAVVPAISFEYELCFRCHGDSEGNSGTVWVQRQYPQTNLRQAFNPGTTSFHPVEVIGKNPSVPSLIPPLSAASLVACDDCHNNDQGPVTGGTGPNGPHGSSYAPLLEKMLLLTDSTPYNANNFALCYKCHSSTVVDSASATSWSSHQTHLENYRAVCTTCHDSHAASNSAHLINFNTTYVLPYNGVTQYISTGPNHGTCTLTCHDGGGQPITHNAVSY
jgi:predicted CXXCH cytochrome family protein